MYSAFYSIPYQGEVKEQGLWGSCYPNAMLSSIEHLLNMAGSPTPQLSRMQSYYDTRDYQGTIDTDSGSVGFIALYAAKTRGIAPESLWAYTDAHMYQQPTQAVYDAASHLKIASYESIYKGVAEDMRDNVLKYLAQGKSVIAGFKIKPYFEPDAEGGHAVEIVGWDNTLNGGSFLIKNSWGTDWGNNGYGSISYRHLAEDFISLEVVTGMHVNGKYLDFSYTPIREKVAEQYATILGRAPDVAGMDWWIENNLSAIATTGVFSDMLINSQEGQMLYGRMGNSEFVKSVYTSVLGRVADIGGLSFWTNALNSGNSRGYIFDSFLSSVNGDSGEQSTLLENKIDLAMYITVGLQYNGGEDIAIRQEMAVVTADDTMLELIKIGIPHDWATL